ncbi:MAG: hypothetical protein QOG16_638 [Actinomycetota bacterium]|nr:hypothetical protein [Actinomycetota bacterium]
MTIPKRSALFVALAIAALVLSGCKIEQGIAFNEDGSGSFTYLVGIDKGILADLGVESPYEGVKQQVEEKGFPVELERYETPDLSGFRLSFEFTTVDDLVEKLKGEEGQAGQQTIQELDLEQGDDGWKLTGAVGAPNLGAGAEMPIDVSELEDRLDMEFSVSMPGAPRDTNADSVREEEDATTFVWTLTPGQSGREISATTELPGSFPTALVAGAGLGSLVIAAVIWLLVRRKRQDASSSAGSIQT